MNILTKIRRWIRPSCVHCLRRLYIQKCEGADGILVSYELYDALEGKKIYPEKYCRPGDVLEFKIPQGKMHE